MLRHSVDNGLQYVFVKSEDKEVTSSSVTRKHSPRALEDK